MDAAVAHHAGRQALRNTPYKGLTPYREEDAALFFGRDEWSAIVTDNLKAYRLTLLYGESGVGKSSVLRAGVAHRLRAQAARTGESEGSPGLAVVVFSAWRHEVEPALVAALDDAGEGAEGNGHGHPPGATLEAAIERCASRCGGRVFLILDQFEEYFVYHPAGDEADDFAAALPRVLARRDLPLSVLISIREDAIARLDRFKSGIPNLFDNYLRLEHLDRAAAREAIERPLERWADLVPGANRASIEPALVDAVLDEVQAGRLEVAEGGAKQIGGGVREVETPYLQLVLTRLWAEESAAGSDVMRLSTLKALGGAQGIVSTHLDKAMGALPPEQRDIAARAFRYLVTRSRSKIAHTVTNLAEWTDVPPDEMSAVLERLSGGDARILRPVGEGSYEIYHDVLADAILGWRAAHEAARRVEEEKRISEQAVRRRLARLALVIGVLAFAVVVLLALLANSERDRAERQGELARRQGDLAASREFAMRSIRFGRVDTDVAIWLAVAAWERSHTAEARTALRQVVSASAVRPPQPISSGNVLSADYNADGTRILIVHPRTADLWEARTRRRLAAWDAESADFSADGTRVASRVRGGVATIRDADDGHVVARVPMPGAVAEAAPGVNHDGTRIAAPLRRGGIGVWDVRTGASLGTRGGARRYSRATFASRRDRLVATERRGRARGVFERLRTRILPAAGAGTSPPIDHSTRYPAIVGPDGRRAFVPREGKGPRLIDVATGRSVAPRIEDLSEFTSAAFAARGRRLITSWRRKAVVWEAGTGQPVERHRFGDPIQATALSADGRVALVVLVSGAIRFWEIGAGRTAPVTPASGRADDFVRSVIVNPDGSQAVTTQFGAKPGVWDLSGVGGAGVVLAGHRGAIRSVAISLRANLIATAARDRTVRFWALRPPRALETFQLGAAPTTVAFDGLGTRIAVAQRDGAASLWDLGARRRVARMRLGRARLTDVAFSPDGRLVVAADAAGKAGIWAAGRSRPLRVLRSDLHSLHSATFYEDGRRVLLAGGTGAETWDIRTGRRVAELGADKRFRIGLGFVPYPGAALNRDGSRVAMVGSDGALRLWDERGRLLRERQAPGRNIVNHAVFSPAGDLIAAGGDDGTVRIVDARTGDDVRTLRALRAQDAQLARVDFSPDGSKVVGIGSDGLTRVWDVASGDRLALLRGRAPFEFYWAAFSPNGDAILTAEGDARLRVRPCLVCVSPEAMIGQAMSSAKRSLSRQERKAYLHER